MPQLTVNPWWTVRCGPFVNLCLARCKQGTMAVPQLGFPGFAAQSKTDILPERRRGSPRSFALHCWAEKCCSARSFQYDATRPLHAIANVMSFCPTQDAQMHPLRTNAPLNCPDAAVPFVASTTSLRNEPAGRFEAVWNNLQIQTAQNHWLSESRARAPQLNP